MIALLEEGGYDWFHIAAHGEFATPSEGGDSTIRLQDGAGFTPADIIGPAITGPIRARRPAFFFNVCEGGRGTMALTGLAGFANRLISAGAGLFIAPLWKVNDEVALRFAQAFYTAFFEGATIAQATRQARQAAYDYAIDDPAWLAYSVYGHPNGRRVSAVG